MSRLAAVPCRIAGTTNNLFRRTTPPTCWIAAVSAAEKTHAEPRRCGGSSRRMKGGNGESEANEVTLCLKCANQTDAAETSSGCSPSSGYVADTRKELFRRNASPNPRLAAVPAAYPERGYISITGGFQPPGEGDDNKTKNRQIPFSFPSSRLA